MSAQKVGATVGASLTAESASKGAQKEGADSRQGLVVFDFDKTLAIVEAGTFLLGDHTMVAKRVFGGVGRVEMLREMLEHLRSEGFALAVISYNSEHNIIKALQNRKVGLLRYFGKVLGRETVMAENCDSAKSYWIKKLATTEARCSEEKCILLDDCLDNIRDMRNNLPHSETVYIDGGKGILPKHAKRVIEWSRNIVSVSQSQSSFVAAENIGETLSGRATTTESV